MVKRLLLALLLLLAGVQLASAKGIFVYENGAWQPVIAPSTFEVGAYHPLKRAWVYESSAWQPVFSTISVSAVTASGSASGTALTQNVATTAGPSTVIGGAPIGSPTVLWTYSSGDAGIAIDSATLQNPTWNETLTTTASNSVTSTAVWNVVATDPATGVTGSTAITVAVTYTNTFSAISVSAPDSFEDAGSCGPSGGGRTCNFTWTGFSTATVTGGSGSYTYAWTYVSGVVPTSTSGTSTASLSMSTNDFCAQQTTCNPSSVWHVHVVDTVTGFTGDAQPTFTGTFTNNTG